ncbi:MAG TPA: sigma-70 family RNA polymerase sigma factor [Gammaproteobacteria bacterium]|nr:sigma-70 family RNA polymerase sigma factor [Gammaproteobacteria bacterium]
MAQGLLERIAAGDQTAVKECMEAYGSLVWSLARRFCASAADAEDATQEIFLEVWKSAARYDAAMGSEAVFLTTIARRRLIDRLRARKRRPATEEFDEEQPPDAVRYEPDLSVQAVEVSIAARALEQLGEAEREILLMGIVEGMTHSEIAMATGKPIGTVKTQLRRGLIKVRAMLGTAGEEPDDG